MIRTNFPRFVLMLSFNLALISGYSQASRQVVILINNNPVKAEIAADGTVTRVIENLGTEDLSGFALKELDYVAYLKTVSPVTQHPPITNVEATKKEIFLADISFTTQAVVLSDQAIALLETVVLNMRDNPDQKIVLKTLQNKDKAVIHTTRSSNIKSYLILRGVPDKKIIIEPSIANKDANEVKIFARKTL